MSGGSINRIMLIARREFLAYVRTVGFWLSLLALPLFGVLGGAISVMVQRAEPVRTAAVVEALAPDANPSGLAAAVRDVLADAQVEQAADVPPMPEGVPPPAPATRRNFILAAPAAPELEAAARADDPRAALDPWLSGERLTPEGERLDAVVILSRAEGSPAAVVWSSRASDRIVERAMRNALSELNRREQLAAIGVDRAALDAIDAFEPVVQVFSPASVGGGEVSLRDRLPGAIGFAGGFLLWSLVITGASMLMNSVMEEKANRVLEVLLSSASSTEILAGKVLGVAALTATVLLVWGAMGAGAFAAFIPEVGADVAAVLLKDGLVFWLLAFLLGGYLMYAVVFAAIGAFCETPRDAQTLMGPIMMILVVPLVVMQMAVRNPDAVAIKVLSWVPLFSPFLMSARAPSGASTLELVGALLAMILMAVVMAWLSSRAFRAGALSDVKLDWKALGRLLKRES